MERDPVPKESPIIVGGSSNKHHRHREVQQGIVPQYGSHRGAHLLRIFPVSKPLSYMSCNHSRSALRVGFAELMMFNKKVAYDAFRFKM